MKKTLCLLLLTLCLFSLRSDSQAAKTQTISSRRGRIVQLIYDFKENKMLIDVAKIVPGDSPGRAQLFFSNDASRQASDMLKDAFLKKRRVEIWVENSDARGRPNVMYQLNMPLY